jgi:hypothetical protein
VRTMTRDNRFYKMGAYLRRFWFRHYGLQEIRCHVCGRKEIRCHVCGRKIRLGSWVLRHRGGLKSE